MTNRGYTPTSADLALAKLHDAAGELLQVALQAQSTALAVLERVSPGDDPSNELRRLAYELYKRSEAAIDKARHD